MESLKFFIHLFIIIYATISMIVYSCNSYKHSRIAMELKESLDEAEYEAEIFRHELKSLVYSIASSVHFIIACVVV
jgi:hypothetical protein